MRGRPVVALVPVRGLGQGKQRLAQVLSAAERKDLVQAMLEDVLQALTRSARVAAVAVVSGDAAVAAVARDFGAVLLPDVPGGGLNPSLQAAIAWAGAANRQHAAMVVAADLPTLTPALLEGTVLASEAEVVIARSHDGGTNVMLQQPPARLPLAFGRESCTRHRGAAIGAGLSVAVLDHALLAQDLDEPEDLTTILPMLERGRTLSVLRRLKNVAGPKGEMDAAMERFHGGGLR